MSLKSSLGRGYLSCSATVTLSHFERHLCVPVRPARMSSHLCRMLAQHLHPAGSPLIPSLRFVGYAEFWTKKGCLCLAYVQTWGQLHLNHPWLAKYSSRLRMARLLCCFSGSICSVCCGLFTACLGNSSGNWKAETSPFFPSSQGISVPADITGC